MNKCDIQTETKGESSGQKMEEKKKERQTNQIKDSEENLSPHPKDWPWKIESLQLGAWSSGIVQINS